MTLKDAIKKSVPFTSLAGYIDTYGDEAYAFIARDLGLTLRPEPALHDSMKRQINDAAREARGEMQRDNEAAMND